MIKVGGTCILFIQLICFAGMDFSEKYRIKCKVRDLMRCPFRSKHINDSMPRILQCDVIIICYVMLLA